MSLAAIAPNLLSTCDQVAPDSKQRTTIDMRKDAFSAEIDFAQRHRTVRKHEHATQHLAPHRSERRSCTRERRTRIARLWWRAIFTWRRTFEYRCSKEMLPSVEESIDVFVALVSTLKARHNPRRSERSRSTRGEFYATREDAFNPRERVAESIDTMHTSVGFRAISIDFNTDDINACFKHCIDRFVRCKKLCSNVHAANTARFRDLYEARNIWMKQWIARSRERHNTITTLSNLLNEPRKSTLCHHCSLHTSESMWTCRTRSLAPRIEFNHEMLRREVGNCVEQLMFEQCNRRARVDVGDTHATFTNSWLNRTAHTNHVARRIEDATHEGASNDVIDLNAYIF
jgi:hypothetical protein